MTDDETPPVDEISGWRELLDGLGQITVAWQAIEQGREEEPGAVRLPPELVASLTRAGQQAAEALAGLAELITEQDDGSASLVDAQREAARRWDDAHRRAAGS